MVSIEAPFNPTMNDATCPLCSASTTQAARFAGRIFRICGRCDLVSVTPSCHLDPARERARYLKHVNTRDNAGYVATFEQSIRCLSQYAPRAHRVLDYGCGPAPVLVELLRERGYAAAGYDPHFFPEPPAPAPFDAIICVETAEHFKTPRADFEHLARLLAPGGCLIVKTSMHRGPASIDGWWYARDPTHVAFYSGATFEWIARHLGYDLVECDEDSLACLRKPSH